METVASDMREALEGCPLSKYILQPDGEKVEIKDLEVALSAGLVHIDVSNCYQCPGLGDLLRKYEGKVKVLANFGKAADKEDDVSPDSIREQCDLILNALGLKTIDVFYQASKDPDASIATVMLELKMLASEGKVAQVGLAECSSDVIKEAHGIHPLSVMTMNKSPWNASSSSPLNETCKELGIKILATRPGAKGLIKLKYADPEMAKNEAQQTMKKLQDKLLARVREVYTIPSRHIVKRTEKILARHASHLLKILTNVVEKQDSKFMEKLQAEEGEQKPVLVKRVITIMKHQSDRLINAVDNMIKEDLNALNESLNAVSSKPDTRVMGVVDRHCAALTEKIVHKVYAMRSKHRENLLIKLSSRLGQKSSTVAMASKVFSRQSKVIMNRLQSIRKRQAEHLMKRLGALQEKKREQGTVCFKKVVEKHNAVLRQRLQGVVSQRPLTESSTDLADAIKEEGKALESKVIWASQFPLKRVVHVCQQASEHQQEVIADKVLNVVDDQLGIHEDTAYTVLGDSFLKENELGSSGASKKRVGRTVLEEGVLLNQHFQAIAKRKGCSVPAVTLAWVRSQGDNIQAIARVGGPRDINKVLKSSQLVLDNADIAELEEATAKFQSQVASLLSWIDIGDPADSDFM